jgi:co-chaperonin GroES (HSP10)
MITSLRTLHDYVLVHQMNFGARKTSGGLQLLGDNMRTAGIRPRWGKVYAIGKDQQDIKVGQWILVSHGRWTRAVHIEDDNGDQMLSRVDNNDILLVTDETPSDDSVSSGILKDAATRWNN